MLLSRSKYFSPADEGGDTSGGTGSNQPSPSGANSNGSADAEGSGFVPKEAYDRLMADLVKYKGRYREADSKINEYKSQEQLRAEEKLLEEKKYQELIENQKKQIGELNDQIGSFKNQQVQAAKYRALVDELGTPVPDKFLPVMPFDEIKVIDGELDMESVKDVAARFKINYSEIFTTKTKDRMSDFPGGSSGKMSVEKYKALGRVKGAKWMQEQLRKRSVDFG